MKKLLVLAGAASQAADWAREYQIPLSSIKYVSEPHHIRGITDPAFVICGTFWTRKDAQEIWMTLQICQRTTTRLTAPADMVNIRKALTDAEDEIVALKAKLEARNNDSQRVEDEEHGRRQFKRIHP